MMKGDKVFAARIEDDKHGKRVVVEQTRVRSVGVAEVTLAPRIWALSYHARFPRGHRKLAETPERALRVLFEDCERAEQNARAALATALQNLNLVYEVQDDPAKYEVRDEKDS